ncbi:MAG: hypothetical protein AMS18_12920 [Gemmatimonas sp. SG8_17]|nr:MAG: hypothetical protein AMS18_12920 [Gemmatimonas sp. SG8_17]
MNFTTYTRIAQALAALGLSLLGASVVSCASGGSAAVPPPSDPTATVVSFLAAVQEGDLARMAQLWGGSSGLTADRIDATEAEQRLTVISIYLEHEEYTIVSGTVNPTILLQPGERLVQVRLTRRGCQPVVPFTLAPYQGGWLIRDIKLADAGNPARVCQGVP